LKDNITYLSSKSKKQIKKMNFSTLVPNWALSLQWPQLLIQLLLRVSLQQ